MIERTVRLASPMEARTPPSGMHRRRCRQWAAGLGLLASMLPGVTQAAASLPWTPDAFTRHQLQLLVDDGGLELPVSQWPLPRGAVLEALGRLPAALPAVLADARSEVLAAIREDDGAGAALTLRGPQEGLAGFGEDALPGSSAALRSPAWQGEWAAAQLGLRVGRPDVGDDGSADLRLEDSAVATEWGGIQLQAWSRRSWWGPGWQNSLVLGDNVPAMTGVGLQRALGSRSQSPWLSWMGPWNAEFFVAQLDDVGTPAHPFLIGNRITLQPLPRLEIALTRTAQWGGRGRDQSLSSFLKALTGSGTNATPDDAQQGIDPASQMAGFDARLRCPTAWRCAGYMQLIGEDLAGHLPSRYLGLYGLESWSANGQHRWFAEVAETGCRMPIGQSAFKACAYRNYVYPEGYVSSHRWLGAGIGPDSRMLTLGWMDTRAATSLKLHVGKVGSRIGRFSPATEDPRFSGNLLGVAARKTFEWRGISVEPELAWVRVDAAQGAQTDARLGVTLRMNLDTLR